MSKLSGFVYIESHVTLRVTSEAQKVNWNDETASDIKSENPLVFFAKTENQMLKKTENPQTARTPKPKNRSF